MLLIYLTVLATLACTSVAAPKGFNFCSLQPPTNFIISNNVTSGYGTLGHPCYTSACYDFFTANPSNMNTTYGLNSQANLVIDFNTQPTHPTGHIAYYSSLGQVGFAAPSFFKGQTGSPKLKCAIEPAANPFNPCQLVCSAKLGKTTITGFSIDTGNDNELFLGDGGGTPVQVLVTFL